MKRNFLFTVIVALIFIMLVPTSIIAGGKKESAPTPSSGTSNVPEKWMEKEAPILHEMVKSGKLPPLEERLPANPLVVTPYEEIGTYGGTFRRGTGFFMADEWLASHIDMNSFFRFPWPEPGSGPIEGNLADKWNFNDDGTELTIHIREGIKWSDGMPFTVDDILFLINDVIADEKVTYTWYHWTNLYVGENQLPDIQRIDDYTLKFIYPSPNFFVETLYSTLAEIALPKHAMKDSHPKYNSSATYDEFNANLVWNAGRGKVTLNAWMLESFSVDEKMTLVRNPYYWKVDTAGNQLPYFDRYEVYVTGDRQGVALGNTTGKFDNDAMWVGTQHLSLFLEAAAERDLTIGYSMVPGMGIYFNFDAADADARKVIRNTEFRKAFSVAINRLKIGKVYFYDMLNPMGSSFSPNSAYFDEKVGKLYSEYDPEKAKSILDNAGIKDTNGDGIRELPSGEKVELIWDVYEHDLYSPIAEMITEDLADVGIRLVLNIKHQNIIMDKLWTGTFEIGTYDFANVDEPLAGLDWWIPLSEGEPFWHKDASTNGAFNSDYAEFSKLMGGARALPFDQRVNAVMKANKLMAENVFVIHIGFYMRPNISSNRIGNLPHKVVRIDEFGSDAPPFMYYQTFEKYPPKN